MGLLGLESESLNPEFPFYDQQASTHKLQKEVYLYI